MTATYRLQLSPDFAFRDAEAILPYLSRLGVSHLYLSPVTEAAPGSTHGYDVHDHNCIRAELGGPEGFERLREAAVRAGLELVLDFVPNHSGVGPDNLPWRDVLAYGPHSAHAHVFDIDWDPLLPDLRGKLLLPFLGRPYGEALDAGEIALAYDDGRFYAEYYGNRFALAPASYALLLERLLPELERSEAYFDLKDLAETYAGLRPEERDRAEGLRVRLVAVARDLGWDELPELEPEELHEVLERQHWRLAYWKTAGYDINYRRFFDINGLAGLRTENPEVFWDIHRLAGELVNLPGVAGLRIDHIDGLFDPEEYLERLRVLGAKRVWVEKILAPGEVLPDAWATAGTTGYEFMNDLLHLLACGAHEEELLRDYRRFTGETASFHEVAVASKRVVMETSLSGELLRLSHDLKRLAEADYHTRDFTQEALKNALAEVIAAFDRYRTYLPRNPDEAREVVLAATRQARRANPAVEATVYDFVARALLEEGRPDLEEKRRAFVGRFQQYTAPVAAKGVEDTAFYRYVPLVALNEVGGEPEGCALEPQAFHARARFRRHRYPENLLATATHDHKRGEDTRMRLLVLAELPDSWAATLAELNAFADEAAGGLEGTSVARKDRYLFFQLLAALWAPGEEESLAERLAVYMRKAVREAKERSSWLDPDEAYEAALERLVRGIVADERLPEALGPLARELARHGFANSLAQLVLKLTSPGVPDLYQGTELLDLSLVDPDNRRPVDYDLRAWFLGELEGLLAEPDENALRAMREAQDPRLKLYVTSRLLRLRRAQPEVFCGDYQPVALGGARADHAVAFLRQGGGDALLAVAPRFPASLERAGGWEDTRLEPPPLPGSGWRDLLSGREFPDEVRLADLPLGAAVLWRV